jgi:hypothetical protein
MPSDVYDGLRLRTFQAVFGKKQCGILINEPIFYVYTIKILKICYIIRY